MSLSRVPGGHGARGAAGHGARPAFGDIEVVVLHLAEDDPRKNTALRLQRTGRARLVKDHRNVPRHAVLLNPFAKKALSREDASVMRRAGLVAVDCSWRNAEGAFAPLLGTTRSRGLPLLWAANPVNWGRPARLSTAEAVAAALWICGFPDQARDVLRRFPFGEEFLRLNKEPLADYAAASTSRGVVAAQAAYLDEEE